LPRRLPRIGLTLGAAAGWAACYRAAIREAGAVPVSIGPDDLARIAECQGLLFTGGRDIHPSLYPRRPEDQRLSDDEVIAKYKLSLAPQRDAFELPLARRALAEGIPSLGICRGFQVLNVAAGGKLVPDIPSCVSGTVKHHFDKGEGAPRHTVDVQADTLFAQITGAGEATPVNTYHHQGITQTELAQGLTAAAVAPDGVIEAVEMPGHPFFLAVQWHPERRKDAEIKERWQTLFEELVRKAAERL